MKKTLILACLAATALSSVVMDANATAVCDGTGVSKSVSVGAGTDAQFLKVAFTAQCSANVHSNYTEDALAMGVVAGSTKGKFFYGGGTNGGGGVKSLGSCATSGCSTAEITDDASGTAKDAT